MTPTRTFLAGLAVLLLLVASLPAPASAAPLNDALRFAQVDFAFGATEMNARVWGELTVEKEKLFAATGIRNGVLNVVTREGGWVVRDLPILDAPARSIQARSVSTYFDLGPAVDGGYRTLDAMVSYGPVSRGEPTNGAFTTFDVGKEVVNAAGDGPGRNPEIDGKIAVGHPPRLERISDQDTPGMAPLLTSRSWIQPHDINLQTAWNQCVPMALANAFQYLEDNTSSRPTGGFQVDHEHAIGLKGDDTIVGQLDTYFGRPGIMDRYTGGGTGGYNPVLNYLRDHATTDGLEIRGQPGTGTYTHAGLDVTQTGPITWTSLCDEIKTGAAVVISWGWYDNNGGRPGGHVVRVYGCGISNGKPWIAYLHDETQASENGDPDDTRGLKWVTEFIGDTDGNGRWNLSGTNREIDGVMSFEYHSKPPVVRPFERAVDVWFEQLTGHRPMNLVAPERFVAGAR